MSVSTHSLHRCAYIPYKQHQSVIFPQYHSAPHITPMWIPKRETCNDDPRERGSISIRHAPPWHADMLERALDKHIQHLSLTLPHRQLKMSNPVVFFDVTAGGSPVGRIEMTVS